MRETINGIVYDTEASIKIAYWNNQMPRDSGKDITEVLYRMPSGEYFLHGAGGPSTRYSKQSEVVSGLYGEGEKIIPMTYAEASVWAREHLLASEYRRVFGHAPVGDGVSFLLSPRVLEALDVLATKNGTSRGEALASCVLDAADKARAQGAAYYSKFDDERDDDERGFIRRLRAGFRR